MSQTILLTGASGQLGATILDHLLSSGFSVNVVLRSFEKSKAFIETKYPSAVSNRRLSFTEIPDMTVTNVFHEPAFKATAIIHVATPVATSDFLKTVIEPTWAINENILNAAAASGTVKRVVVTGSCVSVSRLPQTMFSGRTFSEKDYNDIPLDEAQDEFMSAYQYAKTWSEKNSWEWVERNKPSFDLVFLLATTILGRSLQYNYTANEDHVGGIGQVIGYLFDRKNKSFYFPHYIDADDLAKVHVKSLDATSVPSGRYIISLGPYNINRIADQIREKYPELKGRIEPGGENEIISPQLWNYDTTKMREVFGKEWTSASDSADAIVSDFLAYEAKHGEKVF